MHHDTPGVGKEILVNVPMELEPQLSTTLAALAEKKARNSWEGMGRQIIEPRPEGKLHINKYWAQKVVSVLSSNPAGKDAVIIYPIYHFSPITKRLVKYDTIFPATRGAN